MTAYTHQRRLLTVQEVAARTGQSIDTIRRKIRTGEIPAVQLGGKGFPIRVDAEELDAWMYEESA
ncbi:MAG TPA: helix-turn-helix domain-containing protein [Gaiellaceae bacterium]|nr:helix-turn-helix domain-containing protein [Gaiellaceae bacterium]